MPEKSQAEIGIFGGSGFYSLLKKSFKVTIKTPYGHPSAPISIGEVGGRQVAFMPRHGEGHKFPPHKIPYRANIWAFKKIGVKQVIAPSASGSLQTKVKPGDFVICDQFVDRTKDREDTFFDKEQVAHVSAAYPYCPKMRKIIQKVAKNLKIKIHSKGTAVVINGPRFSTKSESEWFSGQGWEVINMTQYPEAILAKELEMCYLNISLITDYDAGLEGARSIKPVTLDEVIKIFGKNNRKVKKLILKLIPELPKRRSCSCVNSMEGAFI